ncbi:MAG: phosphoadenylyl-sulfate reductase [Polyangiaceae bacterium]|nr:phosphoadenylyl-sulfate reductase [Polyangiaceae bacterium]MCW5792501.1 phosphoadenylyl-sulfate reductase [Polyangiaceae bacterium]
MHITLVKKRLESGEPCRKCAEVEALLEARGVRGLISRVVWADVSEPDSEGWALARRHGVETAPFFIVETPDAPPQVITSALRFIKLAEAARAGSSGGALGAARGAASHEAKSSNEAGGSDAAVGVSGDSASLPAPPTSAAGGAGEAPAPPGLLVSEVEAAAAELAQRAPQHIVRWALTRFGAGLKLAFSGAEDVALLHMAVEAGLPFRCFCLDTGRLHPETHRFIDTVRKHYGVTIELLSPTPGPVEALVRQKGLFSFYDDGHKECCGVRKLEPLRRGLADAACWMTGQRRDQSPTRSEVSVLEVDLGFRGAGPTLFKVNPLANWTLKQVWGYLRAEGVPTNELHERGYVSIGCEPCTRPPRPGEHERAGRWWWEAETQRECGLHVSTRG